MMVLVFALALIGLGCLIAFALRSLDDRTAEPPAEDRAAPYREGLRASIRLQRAAQDLEQQIYAAATRQGDTDGPVDP
jgi:hypothetical protein